MASQASGVNPLRPYYIPPAIGTDFDGINATNATAGNSSSYGGGVVSRQFSQKSNISPYSHKARDIFADLDYKDYLAEPSPSVVQSAKNVVDELIWRYTSVIMAQPFEVAKTILQVRSQPPSGPLAIVESPSAIPTPSSTYTPRHTRRQVPYYAGSAADDPVRSLNLSLFILCPSCVQLYSPKAQLSL